MAAQQREFVRRIASRGEAARMRESASLASKGGISNAPRTVEPIDYESFVDQKTAMLVHDPQKDMVLFPYDDIDGKKQAKNRKTVTSGVPQNAIDNPANQLSKQCVKFYNSEWQIVGYKYASWGVAYDCLPCKHGDRHAELPTQTFEVDETEDRSSSSRADLRVLKHGWLQICKQDLTQVHGANTLNVGKLFRRYYFHLRENTDRTHVLDYGPDERISAEAVESVFLDSAEKVATANYWRRHIVELHMKDGGRRVLAADSIESQASWEAALRDALSRQQRQDSVGGAASSRERPLPLTNGFAESVESLTTLLQKYNTETESLIDSNRNKNRRNIMSVYPELQLRQQKKRSAGSSPRSRPSTTSSCTHPGLVSTDDPDVRPFLDKFENCLRLSAVCERLTTDLQTTSLSNRPDNPEPFLVLLCLVDVQGGVCRRISEDFCWNPNSPETDVMIPEEWFRSRERTGQKHPDEPLLDSGLTEKHLTKCNKCIFSIPQPHPEIYLLARVEKVLQGSISSCAEKYMKHCGDQKAANQQNKAMKAYCSNIGQYRMPFGWACRPLFNVHDSSKMRVNKNNQLELYRHESSKLSEEDLLKHVKDIAQNTDRVGKLQRIPAIFVVRMEEYTENSGRDTDNVVSPSLLPVAPFAADLLSVTKEIDYIPPEGQGSESLVIPNMSYQNIMYVYPREVDYTNLPRNFTRARNLSVFVELKDNDEGDMSPPVKSVFAKPRPNCVVFSTFSNSSVSHHDENPRFHDEMKILLPSSIHEKHHLLFTFYHVSCDTAANIDKSGNSKRHLENRVGYAWIKLHSATREIRTGGFKCRVSINLPSGYLSADSGSKIPNSAGLTPEIRWMDPTKSQFVVVLRLASTVYTSHDKLAGFFTQCASLLESDDRGRSLESGSQDNAVVIRTMNSLKGILAVDLSTIVQFLPPLLNQLLQVLTLTQSEIVQDKALMVLVNLLACLNQSGQGYKLSNEVIRRNHNLLKSYVKYAFALDSIVNTWSRTVHEQLVITTRKFLSSSKTTELDIQRLLHNIWFVLELVAKSIAQFLLATGKIKMNRKSRFSADFEREITALVNCLGEQVVLNTRKKETLPDAERANVNVAMFFRRLLALINRGFVLQLVRSYLDSFSSSEQSAQLRCKFDFLRTLCNYEHFVPLNLPTPRHQLLKDMRTEFSLSDKFRQQHFLVGCLLENLNCALFECPDVRKIAIRVLRDLLAKHSLDERYQRKQQQSRLASLYLPFLGMMVEQKPRFRPPADLEPESSKVQVTRETSRSSAAAPSSTGSSTSNPPAKMMTSPSSNTLSSDNASVSNGSVGLPANGDQQSVHSLHHSSSASSAGRMSLQRGSTSTSSKPADFTLLNAIAGFDSGGALAKYSRDKLLKKDGSASEVSLGSIGAISMGGISCSSINTTASAGSDTTIGPLDGDSPSCVDDADLDSVSKRSSSSRMANKRLEQLNQPFKSNEQRDLLICLLFIVASVENEILLAWFKSLSPNDRVDFFQLLELCLHTFKYRGREKTMTYESISHAGYSANSLSARQARTLATKIQRLSTAQNVSTASGDTLPGLREDTDTGKSPENDKPTEFSSPDKDALNKSKMDGNLSTEVGLIVLDVLCIYIHNFRGDLVSTDLDNPVFRQLFDIFLAFLRTTQSENLLKHAFAGLRLFCSRFCTVLFSGKSGASACGELCYEVMRACNSRLMSTRTESCVLLYLMMKNNWECTGRIKFTRVHLQVIVATSKLVNTEALNSPRFQESLSVLNNLAHADRSVRGPFEELVKELTSTIRRVLAANAHIERYRQDPEMRIDLLYELARSYKNTPRLRLTYLDNMCRIHLEGHENYYDRARDLSEASLCHVHSAALLAQYLRLKNVYIKGCGGFRRISPNVELEESDIIDDSGYEEEGFSEVEIIRRLEKAMEIMEEAERFESVPEIAKLIIPYYEEKREYNKLAELYETNRKCCMKAHDSLTTGKRFLGEFYRVVFFGPGFEEQDRQAYVYKEPKLTRLSEICSRLKELYSPQDATLIQETKVNESQLDSKKNYIQITKVEPYHEPGARPHTDFESVHNVNRFVFEAPFTHSGKRHGDVHEQYRRRTILTTAHHFPYVKKRIAVVRSKDIELSPLAVAVEEIRKKTSLLAEVTAANPPDIKKLQLNLQGTVSVQVNEGPVVYARAFLAADKRAAHLSDPRLRELEGAFKDLVRASRAALSHNYNLIRTEQHEYHLSLEKGFETMRMELSQILDTPLGLEPVQLDVANNDSNA